MGQFDNLSFYYNGLSEPYLHLQRSRECKFTREQVFVALNQHLIDVANRLEVCFGLISVVEGQNTASVGHQRVPFSGVPHRAIRS
jgi:hypothetical protein